MIIAFWISGLLLAYVYVGYPLLCRVLAVLRYQPFNPTEPRTESISIVVAAYNESANIRPRIANIAACERPCKVEVLIGSDGSSDDTAAVAEQAASEYSTDEFRVRVLDLQRGGKLAALRRLAGEATGDVLVFTDANSAFDRYALRRIIKPLADPAIGVAAGAKTIRGGNAETVGGESAYWSFENKLKAWESAYGSCPGADGALYALRRQDFPDVPTDRLLMDDFYISLSVIAKGKRCIFVPEAVAFEPSDTDANTELRRKARIFAGAVNALALQMKLLRPSSGVSLALWSHKVFRWLGFIPLLGLLIGGAALPLAFALPFYLVAVLLLGAATVGYLVPGALALRFIRIPYYFAVLNLGQALGIWTWLKSGRLPTWEKVR